MVEQEVVGQMRLLSQAGWGAKRIALELGVARNTVRRYLRSGDEATRQVRPKRRRLDAEGITRAHELWAGAAAGNAVVVHHLLAMDGIRASVRTIQRAVEERRRQERVAAVASVRFETAPG